MRRKTNTSTLGTLKPECTGCPLLNNHLQGGFHEPEGNTETAKVVIIGQSCGGKASRDSNPNIRKHGSLVLEIIGGRESYYTDAVKCWRYESGRTPPVEAIGLCRKAYLEAELRRIKHGTRVVGIGKLAAHALFHRPRKILELLGLPFEIQKGVQALMTYHPDEYFEHEDRRYATEIDRAINWAYADKDFPKLKINHVKRLPKKQPYIMDLEWTWGHWVGDPECRLTRIGFMPLEGNEIFIVPTNYVSCIRRHVTKIIGHNIAGDLAQLISNKFDIPKDLPSYDTIAGTKIYYPQPEFHYGLKQLGTYMGYPGYNMGFEESEGKLPDAELDTYLARDLFLTRELFRDQMVQREEQPEKQPIEELQMEIIPAAARMIANGAPISETRLDELKVSALTEFLWIEAKLRDQFNWPNLNLSSSVHVSKLLFDILKLTPIDGRKAGKDILALLPGEIPKLLLRYRLRRKQYTTYLKPFYGMIHNSRVYADCMVHGTTTGRFSRHTPPMQTLPRDMRDQIRVPDPTVEVIVSADSDQLEYRLIADLAGEEKLFDEPDIHLSTAKEFFHVEQPVSSQRSLCKTGNYAGLYGGYPKRLAATLKCPIEDAADFLNRLNEMYPRITALRAQVTDFVNKHKRIASPFGREWDFSHVENRWAFQKCIREAFNRIIQSMGHDMIMIWWLEVEKKLPDKVLVINEAHDELVFQCPTSKLNSLLSVCQEAATKIPSELMRRFEYELKVRFTVSTHAATVWEKA